jgi:Tetratricopeptide repeat
LLQDQGDLAGAQPLYERVLAIEERMRALGRDYSLTQPCASHYARLLRETGRAAKALTLGRSLLATHEGALGKNHPWTKDSARITADALDALGRTEAAKALRERYGIAGLENTP